jgi:hypothetical protein
MLAQLVKVANRLDSLGLTKEADILDLEIIRLASDSESGMTRVELARQQVEVAQMAFDKAKEENDKEKSTISGVKFRKARKLSEDAKLELADALAIQEVAPEGATEETPTETQPLVYPEVERRIIRRPNTVEGDITQYSRPSELIIEGEYPKNPKKISDLDPTSFYVFNFVSPESSKPIWLLGGKYSSLEAANSHVGEENDQIVLIGKKVKEYILSGKNIYNSGAMLRLQAPWGGKDVTLFTGMPSTSTPRQKGAE